MEKRNLKKKLTEMFKRGSRSSRYVREESQLRNHI